MKKQEFGNIKQKEVKELQIMVINMRKDMTKLRLEMAMKKVKNVSKLGQNKKDIARILTIIKERMVQNG